MRMPPSSASVFSACILALLWQSSAFTNLQMGRQTGWSRRSLMKGEWNAPELKSICTTTAVADLEDAVLNLWKRKPLYYLTFGMILHKQPLYDLILDLRRALLAERVEVF